MKMLSLGRFSMRQLAIVCGALIMLYVLCSLLGSQQNEQWYLSSAPCVTPKDVIQDIEELAIRAHHILNELKIPHFLCFGSLWGAIRTGMTLPWDNNLDLCTVDELLNKVDSSTLYESFQKQDILLSYNSKEGHYMMLYGQTHGYLTIYRRFYTDMERTGWGRSVLPFLYPHAQNFPARLVQEPFPTKKFHTMDYPVPHEDFELQKYLYPDDWWREMKPTGC